MSTHSDSADTGAGPEKTSVEVRLEVLWAPRFRVLLDTAKKLNKDGYPAAAIVTAHSACEIFTQLVFPRLLRATGRGHLFKPIKKLLPRNYHIGQDEVRKLYVALFEDPIQDEDYWQDFKAGVNARTDVVHRGIMEATKKEATDFIEAVEKVIGHMRSQLPS